jgi:predicted DCC family thiol-disulfide oxidoreductase YuxK
MVADGRATLVFDGECAICRSWVNYWQRLTNKRVVYRPYQDAAADFPAIRREAFERAIWLIEPDGQVFSGAAATYRVLRYAQGHGGWWWMYAHIPGFAAASEWGYAFFARRRGLLSWTTWLLWGPVLEPEHNAVVSWVFLRLLGVIYVAAFASLGVQVAGLVGHDGIWPLRRAPCGKLPAVLQAAPVRGGTARVQQQPMRPTAVSASTTAFMHISAKQRCASPS